MEQTALRKWGNGRGVLIPKKTCDESGVSVGDALAVTVSSDGTIVLRPLGKRVQRHRKVTISELFEGYSGDYQPTEAVWGEPQGKEIW
ncbi:MAG: hypothetical protein LBP28_03655 [Coriobacteriales bacterium]|jgi:antitoxin MazE|nr:hypothetical protein [Coriobacteriales bacterium]